PGLRPGAGCKHRRIPEADRGAAGVSKGDVPGGPEEEIRMTTRVGSLVACALAAFLIAPFALAQPSAARWVLANEYPATSLPGEGDIFFAKAVAHRVAGKLVIAAHADATAGVQP